MASAEVEATGSRGDAAEVARQTGFEQCAQALQRTLVTTPAGWALVAWISWNRAPPGRIGLWLAVFALSWLLGLGLLRLMLRDGPSLERHAGRLLGVAALDGVAWGAIAWLLMGRDPLLDPWLGAVLAGVGAVNAPVYITYLRAFKVQVGAIWAMVVLAGVTHPGRPQALQVVAALTLFYALIVYYMQPIARRVLEGIQLQLSNARLTEQLRVALHLVEQDAATDALTGQANRRALDTLLRQQLELAEQAGRPFSLLLLDIDHFKQVNDAHGHAVGDDTLRAFAARVRDHLRQGDVCARYGGEEFVVVLPGTTIAAAEEVAERLRRGVGEAPLLPGLALSVTVSIGAAEHLRGQTAEQLLMRADAAVYAAKREGRNRVRTAGTAQSG